ncbi:MAG TPA: hypothetical protein VNF04_06595, partial [Stellaceae bacterium]|nr:hypothetical protein [Stellaceae bacterium]
MDEDQLLNRALSAYWATAAREQYSAAIPSTSGSGLYEVGDKDYVALRNGGGVLAVYRVRTDGMLKRLRRW